MKKSKKKKIVSFSIDPRNIKWLGQEAKGLDRSKSWIINKLLEKEREREKS